MTTPNKDSMRRHPAAGRSKVMGRGRGGDAEVVDLATERAIRLLAQAGLIPASAVSHRSGTVR